MQTINITNQQIIEYAKDENKFQLFVFKKKIENGKMTQEDANRKYLIIKRLGKLAELCERKGYTFSDLFALLENLPDKS